MTSDGRPLSFLAVVDLTELPPSTLPDAGFLLFYADLDNDEARGLIEPVGNDAGSPARVLYVDPADEPLPATEPPGSIALSERPVTAVEQLTLPDDYEVEERLGLDPAAASVYQAIAE